MATDVAMTFIADNLPPLTTVVLAMTLIGGRPSKKKIPDIGKMAFGPNYFKIGLFTNPEKDRICNPYPSGSTTKNCALVEWF